MSKQFIRKIIPTFPRFHLTFARSGPTANSSRSKFSQSFGTNAALDALENRRPRVPGNVARTHVAHTVRVLPRALRHPHGISYGLRAPYSGTPSSHFRVGPVAHTRFSKLLPCAFTYLLFAFRIVHF